MIKSNMKIKLSIGHCKGLASHNTLLIRAILMSKGPVCEVGAGLFSTPLLHCLTKMMGRRMITYENNETWFTFAKYFQSKLHRIRKITNWDDMDFKQHWGVVFIDHAPGSRRSQDVINFKDTADYIVMHDTEPKGEKVYGYSKAWPHFKYRYEWTAYTPFASIVSNFYPLDDFEKPFNIHKPD